jgi:histidyl-tRNA synthetase
MLSRVKRNQLPYRAPRGTSDILPREQGYWRYVEEQAHAICQLHGYQRIETPIFEDTRLFVRSIGEETDIVSKEMYSFPDRSGAMMTLRPEGTAPVCRAYIEHGLHNLPQPVRLYYIAPIFRYERPQAGRYRQHQQFGFEAIGDGDPALDAEVIDMAWQFYHRLGLRGLSLKLNNIGCSTCRPSYLESLKGYYAEHIEQLCPDCQRRLVQNPLRLLDCKKESCLGIKESAPRSVDHLCPRCQNHFELVEKYLALLDLPFEVNHRLVRGLDYYTRTVFEIQPQGEEAAQSALGGGGRYDDLIEQLGGKHTPAVGFAAGIERIILNLKRQNTAVPVPPQPDVFISYLGEEAKDKAIEYSSRLRKEGIGAILASSGRSLKAQLKQANALAISHAIIIGEEELGGGKVTVRDMVGGEQRQMSLEEAIESLKGKQQD